MGRTRLRSLLGAAAALTVWMTVGGHQGWPDTNSPRPATASDDAWQPTAAQVRAARDALPGLEVKGRSPKSGYNRGLFLPGGRWPSNGKGCTVRDAVLLAAPITGERSRCSYRSGLLIDPYSGQKVPVSDVEVDHIVALQDAYVKGMRDDTFTPTRKYPDVTAARAALAVDPLNLVAVQGRLNSAKQESDVGSWLPPNRGAWCGMGVRVVLVKKEYGLWVTRAEHDALVRLLGRCPA